MSDDPRWSEALALIDASKAAAARGDDVEFLRLVDEHFKLLDSIAEDPNAAEDDRAAAKEILQNVERMARATTPDALRGMPAASTKDH
jgi:hypothetical protein